MMRQITRRGRQAARILDEGGPRALANRAVGNVVKRLPSPRPVAEVRREDVLAADLTNPPTRPDPPPYEGSLTINWVMAPPGPGSGGHTTLFRLINHLERQGHRCRIYLYDVYGGDAAYYGDTIRGYYPETSATFHDIDEGLGPAHAHVATCWASAYPVYNTTTPGLPFYLVQDYEPWFYAASAEAALAENTYRMGFHAITAGRWLAEKLADDFGMATDHFDFGCDTARYRLDNLGPRSGVVFYARPTAMRRAFTLGIMALEIFAERNPDAVIHLYGEHIDGLPFSHVDHGLVTPDELNTIYNQCYAGLSLSMTNVSLVPHEMLASGCIPIVNEAHHNRVVLDNPVVRYAPASPHELARALQSVSETDDPAQLVSTASTSVQDASWEAAGQQVEAAFVRAVTDGTRRS